MFIKVIGLKQCPTDDDDDDDDTKPNVLLHVPTHTVYSGIEV